MKRINKIIILFFFLIGVMFVATWELLQSKWVADKISKVATVYLEEVLNTDIKFNNLKFNLFPPGAELQNLSLNGYQDGLVIDAEVQKIGLYFNPLDVFNTSFFIDNVQVEDGVVQIWDPKVKQKTKESKEKTPTKIDLNKFVLLEKIPVKKLTLKDMGVKFNDFNFQAKKIQLNNKRNKIHLTGGLQNLRLNQFLETEEIIDEINSDIVIDNRNLRIKSLKIKDDLLAVSTSGLITNYLSKNIDYRLNGKVNLPIEQIHSYLEFSKIGKLYSGELDAKFELIGQGKKINSIVDAKLLNFDTDFAYGEFASVQVGITNKAIRFNEFELKHKDQGIKLLQGFEFLNLDTKKFVEEPIIARATKLKTDNFLKYLWGTLNLLEGSLDGDIKFTLGEKDFKFEALKDVTINELALVVGEKRDLTILKTQDLKMEKGIFHIDNGVFKMDVDAKNGETTFNLNAEIGEDQFRLQMPTGFIELEKVSPIVGMDFGGKGTFSFDLIRDEKNEFILKSKSDFKSFSFEGYKLDKLKANTDFYLDRNSIKIPKLIASSGKSGINFNGEINYKTLDVSGKFNVIDMNFSQTKRILDPLLGKVNLSSNEIHGLWNLDGSISGKATLEELDMKGKFFGKNNYIFDESIDLLNFDFQFNQNKVAINNFNAKKSRGTIKSILEYDFKDKKFDYWVKLNQLPIHEFTYYSKIPLDLKGDLDGTIKGSYEKNAFKLDTIAYLTKAKVFTENFKDSTLSLVIDNDEAKIYLDAFGKEISLDSQIFLDEKRSKQSFAEAKIRVKDLKKTLGVISGIDISNSDIRGFLNYDMSAKFDPYNKAIYDLNSNLQSFQMRKGPIQVSYLNSRPEIEVTNGVIKTWDMNVRGRQFYIISNGLGNLTSDYNTTTRMKIDASILELFGDLVSKASGNVRGKVVYKKLKNDDHYEAFLTSNNLTLNSKFLPTAITKANMKVSLKDKALDIQEFQAQLVSGLLEVSGGVNLNNVIPDVNIRYEFKNAGISVLKKSNLIFSGTGSFIGKTFPYTIGGDFYIQQFVLVNEIADFLGDGDSIIKKDVEYLPGQKSDLSDQLFNFNINVVTREPVYVTNSLADLGFTGNLQVSGGEKEPKLSGKISLAPRNNKVSFKNNEFLFTKGNVFFVERNDFKNPELDFVATTTINDYKISVKVLGPVQEVDFSLSSEPTLTQSDILSLIAFGYTEDLSNNLSDAEKESMTKAGVGSIIFDSFKINETLKNEFGLQVNLGTEISQEEGSYLSRRDSEGSGVGRVSSATTFEIKKKLNDAMSLSVSSTVGNSSSQKQSLNLNYNINNNISVEGVYESRSTDETETINDDNSVGADVKWKWSFK